MDTDERGSLFVYLCESVPHPWLRCFLRTVALHAAIDETPWRIDETPAPMYVLTGMLIGPLSPRGLYRAAASHTCVPGGTSGPITMSRLVRDGRRACTLTHLLHER